MELYYTLNGKRYQVEIIWAKEGKATAYRNALDRICSWHGPEYLRHKDLAEHLDRLSDQIYEILSEFKNETFTSYDPTLSKRLQGIVDDLARGTQTLAEMDEGGVLFALFQQVTDRLKETVKIYLDENRQKNRERMRIKRDKPYNDVPLDDYTENLTDDSADPMDDTVLQMTDLAAKLKCLSETQRRRLTLHIFSSYTTREIANMENTSHVAVAKSIQTALEVLRKQDGECK